MPFNELQRRDSWPPTIMRIRDDEAAAEETSAIDENPFSFFLTSPEELDLDDDDLEDLSAGIETSSKSPGVREISPSGIQRSPLLLEDDDEEEVEYGFGVPLSLKEYALQHVDGRSSRQRQRPEDKLSGLGIMMPKFTSRRGRATFRLTPSRSGRGRGQTRSLSARRPHSWQVPSPDIGTIQEEREGDDGEDMSSTAPKPEMSVSAPPSPEAVKVGVVKPKRVHWAF